jgi:hypothetical protein
MAAVLIAFPWKFPVHIVNGETNLVIVCIIAGIFDGLQGKPEKRLQTQTPFQTLKKQKMSPIKRQRKSYPAIDQPQEGPVLVPLARFRRGKAEFTDRSSGPRRRERSLQLLDGELDSNGLRTIGFARG